MLTEQAETMWLDGLEHLPPKTVVVFTTNNVHRLSIRFIRRCEVYEFDGAGEDFRSALDGFIRWVWSAETGERLDRLPDGLGKFELADDNYSIGLALQQITPYIRTRRPLPAEFHPPIVREALSGGLQSTVDLDILDPEHIVKELRNQLLEVTEELEMFLIAGPV